MPIMTRFAAASPLSSADVHMVLAASDALQIREINLFRLAYARWYGHPPSERAIERPFMRYLFTEQAPVWVRHFAREVLLRLDQGRLDPAEYGLSRRRLPSAGDAFEAWSRVLFVAGWLVIVAVLAVGLF